jgi:hypothetical protein
MQLREIGHRQAELVNSGEIAAVLKLLAFKQELISSLQDIERQLKPYYGQDPERRNWKTADQRAACARLVSECNAMLEEIVHLEKNGAEKMTARRDQVAEQLHHVHAAAHVRSAYEAQRGSHA